MPMFSEDQWIDWVDRLAQDDYTIIDDFISESLYQDIRAFLRRQQEEEEFAKAGIGTMGDYQIKTSVRGDFVYWLDTKRDQELTPFFELAQEMIATLNRYCYLSLSGSEFHLAYYPPGAFYHRHLDQFRERNNRLISVVLYLNEGWQPGDGGELKIFRPDGNDVLCEPLARRCILFKSDVVEHEVLLTHTDRYSLTGWLLYQPASLGYLLA
ncbi:MAG: 2OG-Fe(II) oxygenase [Cyclobacteriaceae bacterium]